MAGDKAIGRRSKERGRIAILGLHLIDRFGIMEGL